MGRGKVIKKISLLFFFCTIIISAQTGYVEYNNPVYNFLERLSAINVISNYNRFELPKTGKDIGNYLLEANNSRAELNVTDLETLNYYLRIFDFDISGSDRNYERFFPEWNFRNHFTTDKNKSAIRYVDDKFSMFVNFEGENKNYSQRSNLYEGFKHITFFKYGGSFRGNFLNHFSYYLKSWNGTFIGNRSLAESESFLKYNFKFNENPAESVNSNYFDETEGYFAVDYDIIKLKIGNDRVVLGYPEAQTVLGVYAPPVDYVMMNINYKFFKFSYLHGKLLGNVYNYMDIENGSRREIEEKYLVYHRFEFNFSKHFTLGLGETIVYSRRGLDLSYLNPFSYYKSVEHVNQDRDNSKIFADFVNNSINGLKFYGMVYIDDLDFSKFGTHWVGNTVLYNLGLTAYPFPDLIPFTIRLNYLRIDPYFYTHRINENTYSSFGLPLGPEYEPNTAAINVMFHYDLKYNLSCKFSYSYSVHGANEYSSTGELIKNNGGDLNYGYFASRDSDAAPFLDGVKEYSRNYNFSIEYQPLPGYFIDYFLTYTNKNSEKLAAEKQTSSGIIFRVKI